MSSAYYGAPENLEHIDTITDPNSYYDFSDVIVVKDTTDGKIYAAHDSGCSCPSPFEDHKFPTDFTELRSVEDFDKFVDGVGTYYTPADVENARIRVHTALTSGRVEGYIPTIRE